MGDSTLSEITSQACWPRRGASSAHTATLYGSWYMMRKPCPASLTVVTRLWPTICFTTCDRVRSIAARTLGCVRHANPRPVNTALHWGLVVCGVQPSNQPHVSARLVSLP